MNRLASKQAILALIIIANALGIFVPLIMGDSALYAQVSKQMVESGDYINLYRNGIDWLDKPHFQFWISALGMEIFGIHDWVFKAVSFLFYLLGLRYTYLLARLYYNKDIAWSATLILASALHIIISNSDVRAEAILMGLSIASTYYYLKILQSWKWKDWFLGGLLAALAVMTKGLFILIPIASAIIAQAIFRQKFLQLLTWRWLLSLPLILILIIPELYTLYVQFDLHPEKIVYGEKDVSGIQFFLWDSQFGRFNNTGPIEGVGHPSFFLSTLLWAFAPWAILFYWALIRKIWKITLHQNRSECATAAGFLVMFIIFSLSGFQLAHYLNILFPFAAILVAFYLFNHHKTWHKWVQYSIIVLLYVSMLMAALIFKLPNLGLLVMTTTILIIFHILIASAQITAHFKFIHHHVLPMVLLGVLLNLCIYPLLFQYQSGTNAAHYVNEHEEKAALVTNSFLYEFYADIPIQRYTSVMDLSEKEKSLIYLNRIALDSLDGVTDKYIIQESFPHFHTTKINLPFLLPDSREESLEERYLIQMED